MSDAIAKPSKKKGPDPREDAFLRFVNRVIDWSRGNLRAVAAGGGVLVLLAGAGLWYVNYSQNLEEEASTRLRSIRSAIASGADTIGVDRLSSFLDRFGDTEAAARARLMLGRLHLRRGDAEQAVEAVRPVADAAPDTPRGYAARMLLAKAQEAAGRPDAALRTLESLASSARFRFQRRRASAERARILVETGRLAEAEEVYRRLVENARPDEAQQMYAVRLGEVQAMQAAGAASPGASSSAGRDSARRSAGTSS